MADNQFVNLHLFLMEEILPVGFAVVDRVQKGKISDLIEGFTDSANIYEELKYEGFNSATRLRDQLDHISPGLGNPIIDVKVDAFQMEDEGIANDVLLSQILQRIDSRIDSIQAYLDQRLVVDP